MNNQSELTAADKELIHEMAVLSSQQPLRKRYFEEKYGTGRDAIELYTLGYTGEFAMCKCLGIPHQMSPELDVYDVLYDGKRYDVKCNSTGFDLCVNSDKESKCYAENPFDDKIDRFALIVWRDPHIWLAGWSSPEFVFQPYHYEAEWHKPGYMVKNKFLNRFPF